MIYGRKGTIHQTDFLDVEVDPLGKVVAVWFRCCPLPFKATTVSDFRASEMERMYDDSPAGRRLIAVEVGEG